MVNASNAGIRLCFYCPPGEVELEYKTVSGSGQSRYGFDVRRGDIRLYFHEGPIGEKGVCRFVNEEAGYVTLWMPIVAGLGLRRLTVP